MAFAKDFSHRQDEQGGLPFYDKVHSPKPDLINPNEDFAKSKGKLQTSHQTSRRRKPVGCAKRMKGPSKDLWEQHRETIIWLYVNEGKTLEQTQAIMAEKYGFWANPGMYKGRFPAWDARKNSGRPKRQGLVDGPKRLKAQAFKTRCNGRRRNVSKKTEYGLNGMLLRLSDEHRRTEELLHSAMAYYELFFTQNHASMHGIRKDPSGSLMHDDVFSAGTVLGTNNRRAAYLLLRVCDGMASWMRDQALSPLILNTATRHVNQTSKSLLQVQLDIARLFFEAECYDEAESLCTQSLQLADTNHQHDIISLGPLLLIGDMYWEQRRDDEAKEVLFQTLRASEGIKRGPELTCNQSYTFRQLGLIFEEENDYYWSTFFYFLAFSSRLAIDGTDTLGTTGIETG
ncbi:hypothetical protein DV736_g3018, partial [Chaetothyriales sp. CBS 134916]